MVKIRNFIFIVFLAKSMVGGHTQGHSKKGKREKKVGQGLPWALVTSLANISSKHKSKKIGKREKKRGKEIL